MLGGEGIGQEFATLYPVAHIFEQRTEELVALTLDEQIKGGQDRQSGLDQGQELLVENQERARFDTGATPNRHALGTEDASGLDPINQIALLGKPVTDL